MNFIKEFNAEIVKENPTWVVKGVISDNDKIYSFGTDTKILSRVFELLAYPYVKAVAEKNGYQIEISAEQTVYPDFTLYKNKTSKKKIAVDIKTTYRKGNSAFGFTLGSYTSFLRNGTKNILYPYAEYSKHYIIGFVYDRNTQTSRSTDVEDLKNRSQIAPSYKNVELFVQEKYKISGEQPGSGNTANLGSIKSKKITDFSSGKGPFSKLGESIFREYWANYSGGKKATYKNITDFNNWKKNKVTP